MHDYKPNSNRFKAEQKEMAERKPVEKVVRGTVKVRKKNEIRKFADRFISEDAGNVKSYIVNDVIIPAIKNTFLDIIIDGAKMIFGGSGHSRGGSASSKVSYRNYYERKGDRYGSPSEPRSRNGYTFDEVTLESRGEAEEVLDQLQGIIDTYKVARVADLNDLLGITGDYTENRYGWTNIRNAKVERVRDGYRLSMPRALPID